MTDTPAEVYLSDEQIVEIIQETDRAHPNTDMWGFRLLTQRAIADAATDQAYKVGFEDAKREHIRICNPLLEQAVEKMAEIQAKYAALVVLLEEARPIVRNVYTVFGTKEHWDKVALVRRIDATLTP